MKKTEAEKFTLRNRKIYSIYLGDELNEDTYYRSIQVGTFDRNLTLDFISQWPEKYTLNKLNLVDNLCRMNNTSGSYFI
jgi:hypothetical protein